ncbi:MAG: hypothetical protein HY744_24975 [Deltaproteobacteria bacterium]|nr:hypothetical protein [Deltaproteobacteria bacterium]
MPISTRKTLAAGPLCGPAGTAEGASVPAGAPGSTPAPELIEARHRP